MGMRDFNSTRPSPSVEKRVVTNSRRCATPGTNMQTAKNCFVRCMNKTNIGSGTVNACRARKRRIFEPTSMLRASRREARNDPDTVTERGEEEDITYHPPLLVFWDTEAMQEIRACMCLIWWWV